MLNEAELTVACDNTQNEEKANILTSCTTKHKQQPQLYFNNYCLLHSLTSISNILCENISDLEPRFTHGQMIYIYKMTKYT